MRRALCTLLLLLSVAPVAPVAPAGAAPDGEVVLSGSRSGWTEVAFPRRFTPMLGIGGDGVHATTKGTFAGVYFENVARPALSQGGVMVPAMGRDMPVAWGGSDREDFTLPAGRYRVHLLADAPATVRVKVDGLGRVLRLAPRQPSDVRGRLVRVEAVRAVIPVLVRPTTTTVMVGYTYSEPSIGSAAKVCLDEGRAQSCEAGDGYGASVAMVTPGLWAKTSVGATVYPGMASSGEHEARYAVVSATPTATLYAFALSLF